MRTLSHKSKEKGAQSERREIEPPVGSAGVLREELVVFDAHALTHADGGARRVGEALQRSIVQAHIHNPGHAPVLVAPHLIAHRAEVMAALEG